MYDVEVVSGSKAMDVAVDPTDGKILSATADASDPEDENDAED